jgi:N-acetylglucosaminyl-diphospho-decaprenol L-rhamnosyltransferase
MMVASPFVLGVAVVSYNTRDVLATCLVSLVSEGVEDVTVVDNGSTDGTAELVRDRFPNFRLKINEGNRGYGAAANDAMRSSPCAALLVLNSDTVVDAGALASLTAYLSAHPEAGLVGPRLVNPDHSLQPSCFPFPGMIDALVSETGIHRLLRLIPGLRELFLRTWSHDRARRVPWVLGAALAIRLSAFAAVDGFDEEIFMYGEEVDFARRLAAAGYETHFTPAATVMHIGGASSGDQLATYPARVAATRRYLQRYASLPNRLGFLSVMRLVVAARLIRDRAHLAVAPSDKWPLLRHRIETWKAVTCNLGSWGA